MGRAIAMIAGSSGAGVPQFFGGLRRFLTDFWDHIAHPYRPELHYMRGPGPACRARARNATTPD